MFDEAARNLRAFAGDEYRSAARGARIGIWSVVGDDGLLTMRAGGLGARQQFNRESALHQRLFYACSVPLKRGGVSESPHPGIDQDEDRKADGAEKDRPVAPIRPLALFAHG
jgi:hypothetical protein